MGLPVVFYEQNTHRQSGLVHFVADVGGIGDHGILRDYGRQHNNS
jgi:hypothetical protein